MILSDISIREALGAGRIVIDPLDESCIQPSSIDVKISNLFRVFRNHTAPVIDVKKDLTDLTELIEVPLDGVFMLHPGEFVLGACCNRRRPCCSCRGQKFTRSSWFAHSLHSWLY